MSSNLTTPVDSLGDWMDSVVGSFATTIKKSQSGIGSAARDVGSGIQTQLMSGLSGVKTQFQQLWTDLQGITKTAVGSNDDNESQGKIIACYGVGCDLRMYVQQSDFTIHSTTERLDQILKLDESCDYFYKIRIPRKIRKKLLVQLDAMGFNESSIYPDMEHIAKEQVTSHFNF